MSTATKKKNDKTTAKIINLGKEIELKKLGVVTVRELCLEDVLVLSKELVDILNAIQGQDSADGMSVIVSMLQEDATARAVRRVAASTTDRSPEDFEKMGIGDWFKWAAAFKEVCDWDELKELFTHLVPKDVLQSLGTSQEKQSVKPLQNSSITSQTSTVGLPKQS